MIIPINVWICVSEPFCSVFTRPPTLDELRLVFGDDAEHVNIYETEYEYDTDLDEPSETVRLKGLQLVADVNKAIEENTK